MFLTNAACVCVAYGNPSCGIRECSITSGCGCADRRVHPLLLCEGLARAVLRHHGNIGNPHWSALLMECNGAAYHHHAALRLKHAGVHAGRQGIIGLPLLEGIRQACTTAEGAVKQMNPAAVSRS